MGCPGQEEAGHRPGGSRAGRRPRAHRPPPPPPQRSLTTTGEDAGRRDEVRAPRPRSAGQSVRPPPPWPRPLQPPGRHQRRPGGVDSSDPGPGEGEPPPGSPSAHLTHMLLKRNRSSQVKARSVVITPPPPKRNRCNFARPAGSHPASARPAGSHPSEQTPLGKAENFFRATSCSATTQRRSSL